MVDYLQQVLETKLHKNHYLDYLPKENNGSPDYL
jgi:hypothetical protein